MSLPLDNPAPKTKTELLSRLRKVLDAGWLDMPADVARYNGTGGPGNYLEDLLGLAAGNKDIPDGVGWEVKFHTPKTSLITLFHKEPEPEGILRYVVSKYGWKDKQGRLSFRHTIHGQSDRFTVVNDAGSIIVRSLHGDDPVPMWSHDTLLNIAGSKLRRLVAASGIRKEHTVKFVSAELYQELALTQFMQKLTSGQIVIDFDVRENTPGSKGLRNHGTKFRVSPKDLVHIYLKHEHFS